MSFFSIIIPVYNTDEKYFDFCMESILKQSFADFEVIIVDDGSNEACAKNCDRYADGDERVHVIHQANQGVSAARNTGISAAASDYIMFVDADDYLELDACERVKQYLGNHDCDMLMYNLIKQYANKSVISRCGLQHKRIYSGVNIQDKELLYRRVMGAVSNKPSEQNVIYYSCDKVFRRNFLVENGLQYPVGIPKSEDKVFIACCFEKLGKLLYVDESLYHYRINAASACNRYSKNADLDRIALSEILFSIALRMDVELAVLHEEKCYNKITKACYRFLFGIISDVLFLKYYHPDNPDGAKKRSQEALAFIHTEPFASAIRECKYGELSLIAKVKKMMLSMNLVSAFCFLYGLYKRISGRIAEE